MAGASSPVIPLLDTEFRVCMRAFEKELFFYCLQIQGLVVTSLSWFIAFDTADQVENADLRQLLKIRASLHDNLDRSPYSLGLYLSVCQVYQSLGYPDLAAGAAYKALLVADAVQDESDEYHEQATETLQDDLPRLLPWLETLWRSEDDGSGSLPDLAQADTASHSRPEQPASDAENIGAWAKERALPVIHSLLAANLYHCRCFRSAYQQCQLGLAYNNQHPWLLLIRETILHGVRKYFATVGDVVPETLDSDLDSWPDSGHVRREHYPWNTEEPDRFSAESLAELNDAMAQVAPKLEVKAVELPALARTDVIKGATSKQLGVFAKDDVKPGELILEETSLLTANNRLQDAICDACGVEIITGSEAVTCEECFVPFCSERCHDLALGAYHPAVCDKDIDSIGRDVPAAQAADSLYLLLLIRSLAMAETQEVHPLSLKEVKYIWGDYHTSSLAIPPSCAPTELLDLEAAHAHLPRTLSFSFQNNIVLPFHTLTKMDVDIFAEHRRYDVWTFNTLFAKFRGTASARLSQSGTSSTHDGGLKLGRGRPRGPEVSAVHPLWCLANHSCDPNVAWEWGGTVRFTARRERRRWRRGREGREETKGPVEAGLRKGEEVLGHYCDIELPVKERREWAVGALGGDCRCGRCVWEAGEV